MGRILKRCAHCNADRAYYREVPPTKGPLASICVACKHCGMSTRLMKYVPDDPESKRGAIEKATRFWNRRGGEL